MLLAPYSDMMELGQGFNSFLQEACMFGAVTIPENDLETPASPTDESVSVLQTVTYSSRFVEKVSDVVRSTNTSAAQSLKYNVIGSPRNSLAINESKFASSDWNLCIPVNLINREWY